eukprot:220294_1
MAIESQNEMEKLREKAKQLMNKEREIRYDENGNILDVQMFILKPKIDHRVMTVEDEKPWLKSSIIIPLMPMTTRKERKQVMRLLLLLLRITT